MAQQKKASFSVYSTLTNKMVTLIRKQSKEAKKKTDREVLTAFLIRYPSFGGDQSVAILSEEHHFSKNGSQVIFPESPQILDNLLKARFKIDSIAGFDLPFPSFVLAIPKGYELDGIRLPSMLVTWMAKDRTIPEITDPFFSYYRLPSSSFGAIDYASDAVLSIAFTDEEDGEKCRTYVSASHIQDILSAKDPEDYRDEMVRKGFIGSISQISDKNAVLQYYGFKLVAALGIYHVATKGERLKEGFPGATAPRLDGLLGQSKITPATLANSTPPLKEGDSARAAHYRTWYFRQLRAARYYQGEYADQAPGTRYSFVQETVVGLKVSPSTQT